MKCSKHKSEPDHSWSYLFRSEAVALFLCTPLQATVNSLKHFKVGLENSHDDWNYVYDTAIDV